MDNMDTIYDSRDSPFDSPKRWLVLTLCSFLFILSQFYRVSNAIIAPLLQADLDMSSESLGLLGAVFFYTFAIAQIPLGLMLDRIGARRIMTVLSIVASAGAVLFASSHSMTTAILGRALLGIGMAGNYMGSLKLFTRWFSPREFATLSGVIVALGMIGSMVAATPLAIMVNMFGWRWTFILIGIATFILALIFFFLVTDSPGNLDEQGKGDQKGSSTLHHIRILFKSYNYWIICSGTFLRYGLFVAIQGLWVGPYLIKGLGYSPVKAGNLLLILNIGYIIGSPLAGWLSDRVIHSRKRVILFGMAVMALTIFALSNDRCNISVWVLGAVLFSFGIFCSFGGLMYAHIKDLMPSDMSGMALTGINLFTMLGGAVMMQGMGMILGQASPAGGDPGLDDFQQLFFYGFLSTLFALGLYSFTKEEKY